ncbi:hypothetical protein GCM10010912_43960 [Paenibacillus albidus]|uniref:Uncharacterized protein n=1 Tax=Paenibacillus albidus TaxID=2041023 RepID=A0A917FQ20_9BACL|nr:hypothetical protein GCM10010912_43960 [Paenibacillus albidus]
MFAERISPRQKAVRAADSSTVKTAFDTLQRLYGHSLGIPAVLQIKSRVQSPCVLMSRLYYR